MKLRTGFIFCLFFLGSASAKTIQVAPPAGDSAVDLASVDAALSVAGPGDVIQFDHGTYVIGRPWPGTEIRIERLTLLGHPNGTTLRGGEVIDYGNPLGFALRSPKQTVRGLRFESFAWALEVGDYLAELGGYLVEDCVFDTVFGGFPTLTGGDLTVVRNNTFINCAIGFWAMGSDARFSANVFTAPNPSSIPIEHRVWQAAGVYATDYLHPCVNLRFENNSVIGLPDGFPVYCFPGAVCRNIMIADNTCTSMTRRDPADVGSLVSIWALEPLVFENLTISGNTLQGSDGWLGVLSSGGTGIRVLNNTFRDMPNGVGVVLDLGSDGSAVHGNTFENVNYEEVIVLSNDNLVVTESPDDEVLDLGEGNRVVGRTLRDERSQGLLQALAARSKAVEKLWRSAR
ncbi:MAG: hypothetical protein EHM23_27775 [Acidobacteria bacterium]|nr:MAG: hypothetical protein EHM23_27775 [Acidobacteriota bacterium]